MTAPTPTPVPVSVPVLAINRAADRDRLAACRASAAAAGLDAARIAAIDAHRADFAAALHDDLIGPTFWGGAEAKPGAIGCFLSHRRAWQHIADRGLARALIVEDDARFLDGPARLDAVAAGLPGADLIFVNQRLAAWAGLVAGAGEAVPLDEVVAAVAAAGGPAAAGLTAAPGADGYLLTGAGAGRLLSLTARQRIQCGVDWALVWNGLAAPGRAAGIAEIAILAGLLPPPEAPLSAHVLTRPIVAQDGGPSTIRHRITRPLADLLDRTPTIAHAEYVTRIALGGAYLTFAGRSGPDPVMAAHRAGRLWDEPGLRLLLARFPEGGTFVDIGAHIGNHAVAMARLGGAARVIAAEPNDEIVRLLQINLAMNRVAERVEIAETALGMADGEAWLLRNRKRSSETMVKADIAPEARASAPRVPVTTGDRLIGDAPVHAVKIDTAGSEIEVLRGLGQTLARQRPMVLIDHAEAAAERIATVGAEYGLRLVETVPSGRKRRASSLLVPRG